MTHSVIPEEAARLATEAVRNRMLESGDFAAAAEEAILAALPPIAGRTTVMSRRIGSVLLVCLVWVS